MSPVAPAIAPSAGAAAKDVKKESATARLLGSGKSSDVPKHRLIADSSLF